MIDLYHTENITIQSTILPNPFLPPSRYVIILSEIVADWNWIYSAREETRRWELVGLGAGAGATGQRAGGGGSGGSGPGSGRWGRRPGRCGPGGRGAAGRRSQSNLPWEMGQTLGQDPVEVSIAQ